MNEVEAIKEAIEVAKSRLRDAAAMSQRRFDEARKRVEDLKARPEYAEAMAEFHAAQKERGYVFDMAESLGVNVGWRE